MPENDWGRPGPAEPPEYYYLPCPECEGEFPPDSKHIREGCDAFPEGLSDLPDPTDEMPEGWLSVTPELEQEMTEFYEQRDRLPDPYEDN